MATVCFSKAKDSLAADFMIEKNRTKNVERAKLQGEKDIRYRRCIEVLKEVFMYVFIVVKSVNF